MKQLLPIIFFLLGCNVINNYPDSFKTIEQIDYSFDSGWRETYSIKINSNGNCIIGEGRWSIKYYTGKLTETDMKELDSMVKSIQFKQFDSSYIEDVVDQSSYKIFLIEKNRDTIVKFVYGRTAPQQLNAFSNRISLLKNTLKLIQKDTVVEFISRKNFYPPSIEAPPNKF